MENAVMYGCFDNAFNSRDCHLSARTVMARRGLNKHNRVLYCFNASKPTNAPIRCYQIGFRWNIFSLVVALLREFGIRIIILSVKEFFATTNSRNDVNKFDVSCTLWIFVKGFHKRIYDAKKQIDALNPFWDI